VDRAPIDTLLEAGQLPNRPDIAGAREIVRSQGWLSTTPLRFRQEIIERCFVGEYETGQTVLKPGGEASAIYGVVSGCLATSVTTFNGFQSLTGLLHPGSWFDAATVFLREPSGIRLSAARQTQVLILPMGEIDAMLADPSLGSTGLQQFARFAARDKRACWKTAFDLTLRDATLR